MLAGLALTGAGCSGSGGSDTGAGAGGSSVFDVVFADKDGTTISDRYVDAIPVSVYELAREVKPAEVPKLKSELQTVIDQLMSSTTSAKIAEPLEEVTVNGVPGFGFKYTYTEGGTELTAVAFFLFKGKYEYEITAQTTSDNWDALKGKLEAATQTFTAK